MTHTFNPSILREYDVRGIFGDTLTAADAYALGRGFAALATGEGARRIAVGRDGTIAMPFNSPGLFRGAMDSSGRFETGIF